MTSSAVRGGKVQLLKNLHILTFSTGKKKHLLREHLLPVFLEV
jgi:hypothetical protein